METEGEKGVRDDPYDFHLNNWIVAEMVVEDEELMGLLLGCVWS